MADISIVNGQHVRITQHCASLASRFVAQLIDGFLLYFYYYSLIEAYDMLGLRDLINPWVTLFLFIFPAIFYFPLCETFRNGQTLGKQIVGIRVVRIDGEPLSFSNALLRYLLLIIDEFFGMGLGAILIAMTKHSQRLGDMAAGTAVVHDRAYRHPRVNLTHYQFLLHDYKPRFHRAAELNARQAATIEHTLADTSARHAERLERLTAKVERICGKRTDDANDDATDYATDNAPSPEPYLRQVLNDYRFFQLGEEASPQQQPLA